MYPYYKPAVVIGILSMLLYASTTMADAIVRSQAMFADLDGRPVLFSHPVYQYLQRRYAVNGKSMLWEPDEEPSTPDWIGLQQTLRMHPSTIMIWEDKPLKSTAQRLSDAGINAVTFHTAANRPAEGNFLGMMQTNAERIASLL